MLDKEKIKKEMNGVVEIFRNDIGSIRTGRATAALIENVQVGVSKYGGQKIALKQLGSIGVPDARTLTFSPWDKEILKEVKNALMGANLGFNPVVDGDLIRLSLPPLSVEQREDYVKLLGRKLEGVRNMLRQIRADERRRLQDSKQAGEISEDEYRGDEEELQKLTDEYTGLLEEIAEKKEEEIRG